MTFIWLLAELVRSIVFVLVVNLLHHGITTSPTGWIDGALFGIVAGATYYFVTRWKVNDTDNNELPGHASWTVSLAHMFVAREGPLITVVRMGVQLLGALAASGLLHFLGAHVVPTNPNVPVQWFIELFVPALIVFAILYNNMAGAKRADEKEHEEKGQFHGSAIRAFFTACFYTLFSGYSFESIVYLGGLFATCWNGACNSQAPFTGAWAFYTFVPLLGMAIGVVLYLIMIVFYSCLNVDENPIGGGRVGRFVRGKKAMAQEEARPAPAEAAISRARPQDLENPKSL